MSYTEILLVAGGVAGIYVLVLALALVADKVDPMRVEKVGRIPSSKGVRTYTEFTEPKK